MGAETPILLTDDEAARSLRVNTRHLLRMARAGRVPSIVLPDGQIRFLRDDLVRWVATYRRPAADVGVPA